MSSISVSDGTKAEFKDLMPEHCDTQEDFVQELLSVYRAAGTATVDVDTFVDEIRRELASQAEIGATRGVNEALFGDPDADEQALLTEVGE